MASSVPNATPLTGDTIEQLGVTLWRLRPAPAGAAEKQEAEARLLIRESNQTSEWIPERIEMDTPLHTGDRVRLSIESPRAGFLYIVDRDLFADGKFGNALLLFPTHKIYGGDNQAGPGKLIDLPGQFADPNYFTVQASRSAQGSEQIGEILTIIITSKPLDLEIGEVPLPISTTEIAKWEKDWSSLTERFEMTGGAGLSWTREEKEASATGTRQLTRNEPPPQTIYRLAAPSTTAFLVNVQLSYSK